MDDSLGGTDFTTKDILNFLNNGPEEGRETGMPNFDWRNIFNITDQIIRMFNQYGEVRNTNFSFTSESYFPLLRKNMPILHFAKCCTFPGLGVQPFGDQLSVLQTGASVFQVCSQEIAARPF